MSKKKKNEEASEEQVLNEEEKKEQESTDKSTSEDLTPEEKLMEEIKKLEAQSKEYFEGWQRERADFQNYKRRIEREQVSLKGYILSEVVKKYLVIIDDMELAVKNRPSKDECQDWADGINLIYQKLLSILEGEGVEAIPIDGEFNPNIHEAISQIDHPEIESGKIVEVMRRGYKIGDKVIRPAMVVVAR